MENKTAFEKVNDRAVRLFERMLYNDGLGYRKDKNLLRELFDRYATMCLPNSREFYVRMFHENPDLYDPESLTLDGLDDVHSMDHIDVVREAAKLRVIKNLFYAYNHWLIGMRWVVFDLYEDGRIEIVSLSPEPPSFYEEPYDDE